MARLKSRSPLESEGGIASKADAAAVAAEAAVGVRSRETEVIHPAFLDAQTMDMPVPAMAQPMPTFHIAISAAVVAAAAMAAFYNGSLDSR